MVLSSGLNYIETTESTNSFLLEYPQRLENGTALYSLHQTKGRGRLGRKWEEIKGGNLALSVVYELSVGQLSPIPLLAGLATAKALGELFEREFLLKWSNDVIVDGKKVAGILCDSRISKDGSRIVMGIGINILGKEEYFIEKGLSHATSLEALGIRNAVVKPLAQSIVDSLGKHMTNFLESGFQFYKNEYAQNCVTLGREIMLAEGGRQTRGDAVGINDDGALIYIANGKKALAYGGEVSVRGLYGYI